MATDYFGMPEPFHVEAAGARFPVVSAGSGAAVLFVHGGWADLRIWSGVWARIAEKHEFLALTQRHFGRDGWPDTKPYAREVHTADLIAVLGALDKSVHLVGWSYAGAIVLRAAAALPAQVRSVTIFEPSYESEALPSDADTRSAREAFWQMLEPAYDLARSGGDLAKAMRWGVEVVFGLPRGAFETLDCANQTVFLENTHTFMLDLEAPPSVPLTSSELQKIACPVLIAHGERTHAQYRLMAAATLAKLPSGSGRQLDGVGHGGPIQVAGRFVDVVLDFVGAARA